MKGRNDVEFADNMGPRVFVPTHGVAPGRVGSEDYNHAVIAGLSARGYRVTACGPQQPAFSGMGNVEWLPLASVPQPGRLGWRLSYALQVLHIYREIQRLGTSRWDVVVSGLLPALWSTRRLWRAVPQVYIPQSVLAAREIITYGAPWTQKHLGALTYNALQASAWRRSDVVVSYNQTTAAIRNRHFGFQPRRLILSSPGVNTERFLPAPRDPSLLTALGIPIEAPVVLSIGRLVLSKDLSFLLRAFANPVTPPSAHLLVVGEGPCSNDLKILANRLGIGDRVHLVGFRDDVERYFALGNVYVMPSVMESFGLALVQALACGLPAIARRSKYPTVLTASEGIIDEGRTGFLIDTEQELADRMTELLVNPTLAETMGASAVASMHDRFSWSSHIDALDRAVTIAMSGGRDNIYSALGRPHDSAAQPFHTVPTAT
jgi:glycosyltransferase involved in cell wall biosynthesis